MKKIHARPYSETQFASENHFGGEVHVHLQDGSCIAAKVQEPLGRTSDNPLPKV
jgi:hypothetical protein